MSSLVDNKSLNERADEGKIFVCCACGKVSPDQYGVMESRPGERARSAGWDESCMLNCEEFDVAKLEFSPGGRVVRVLP